MTKDELQQILDSIHTVDTRLARVEERTASLPERLSSLERWRERIVGVSMTAGAISGFLTGFFLWILARIF